MTDAVALDCCWLVHSGECDGEQFLGALHLLGKLDKHQVSLLFDCENHIYGEYIRHVTSGVGRQFIQSCIRGGRVQYFSNRLTAAANAKLDAIGFDPSDRPYLGVAAAHGQAPYVTTEKKHLEPAQAAAIQAASGVEVLDTAGALGRFT